MQDDLSLAGVIEVTVKAYGRDNDSDLIVLTKCSSRHGINDSNICCEENFDMLECAIPNCCGHDKFLRSGTLHLADIVQKDGSVAQKMIWLCDECTQRYTVQTWRPPGEQIRPRIQSSFSLADIIVARVSSTLTR